MRPLAVWFGVAAVLLLHLVAGLVVGTVVAGWELGCRIGARA